MGIYIKGISKDFFLDMYHQTKGGTYMGFNPDDITEVEEPHGKLIDSNYLFSAFPPDRGMLHVYSARATITTAPATIEAEGDEDTSTDCQWI